MKKIFTLASLFVILLLNNSFAANSQNIAILDIEKIAKEARAVKDIQSKVSKKQEQFQAEINVKQEKLESEQKRIESKKNILSKEAFEKEQKDFVKKLEDLKTFVDKRQGSLKKASTESMEVVNEKMKEVVSKMAQEKSFTIILPSSQVVFSVDGLDITEEVLKRLDKEVSKVSVKFE